VSAFLRAIVYEKQLEKVLIERKMAADSKAKKSNQLDFGI